MKKFLLLLLGFCVAGLAAWAVPREHEHKPIKIEFTKFVSDNAIVIQIAGETDLQAVQAWQSPSMIMTAEVPGTVIAPKIRWRRCLSEFYVARNFSRLNSPNDAIRLLVDRRHLPDIL